MTAVARAGTADLDDLAPLFDGYRVFYRQPSDIAGARAFVAERMAQKEAVVFVARDDAGAAVGFVQLYPSFSSVAMRPIWILNDLFVTPAARRSGAGAALMAAARGFATAQGAKRLELTTERGNLTAQALYERSGYRRDDSFFRFTLPLE